MKPPEGHTANDASNAGRPARQWLKPALRVLLLLALITFVLSTETCQNRLFLFPSSTINKTPAEVGLKAEEVTFRNPAGKLLSGWYFQADKPIGAVVLNHGNSGNVGLYLDYARMLTQANVSLLLYDYQGFGKSEGSASIRSLTGDALAAFDYVASRGNAPGGIAVMGVSLGTPISCAVAAQRPAARGLILEGAFLPKEELFWHMGTLGWPVAVVVSNTMPQMHPEQVVKALSGRPLLMIHGSVDRTTPVSGAAKLFECARQPKWLWVMHARGHFPEPAFYEGDQYQQVLAAFMRLAFLGEPFVQPRIDWAAKKLENGEWEVTVTLLEDECNGPVSVVAITDRNETAMRSLARREDEPIKLYVPRQPIAVTVFAEPPVRTSKSVGK